MCSYAARKYQVQNLFTTAMIQLPKTLVGLILDSPKNGLKLICESPNEVHVNTNYGIV